MNTGKYSFILQKRAKIFPQFTFNLWNAAYYSIRDTSHSIARPESPESPDWQEKGLEWKLRVEIYEMFIRLKILEDSYIQRDSRNDRVVDL